MAARRLQPSNASRIGAIQPEQPLFPDRANRCKTLDPLFVARQRPSFEAVADAEPDVDARTGRRVELRRFNPEFVRRRARADCEEQRGGKERNAAVTFRA